MIQRLIAIGAVLLAVQIGLAIIVNKESTVLEASSPDTLFLSLNPAEVSSIEIIGEENTHLVLQRSKDGWTLPNTFAAPADGEQVNNLLEKLATVKQGMAVATTAGAPKRFKTAEDAFERHLVIKAGDTPVADFYLGSSAGFRYSHARKADLNEIVTIPISNFEVEIDADKWLDRNLAKLKKDDVQGLQLADISMTRNGTGWSVDNLAGDQTSQEEVENLLTRVTGIAVQSVLAPHDVSSLFDDKTTEFTVTMKDGSKITYMIARQDDDYVLKMSNSDLYFKANTYQAEGIGNFNLASLTLKKEKGEEPSNEEQQ
jgi:hypothetical protein